jgi:hypothetical protein
MGKAAKMKEETKERVKGTIIFFVFWVSLIIMWLLIEGCVHLDPIPDDPKPDDPPPVATEEDCKAACDNLKQMKCPGWDGTPGKDEIQGTADDVPCWKACINIMSVGHPADLKLPCTIKATSCEEVESCFD